MLAELKSNRLWLVFDIGFIVSIGMGLYLRDRAGIGLAVTMFIPLLWFGIAASLRSFDRPRLVFWGITFFYLIVVQLIALFYHGYPGDIRPQNAWDPGSLYVLAGTLGILVAVLQMCGEVIFTETLTKSLVVLI